MARTAKMRAVPARLTHVLLSLCGLAAFVTLAEIVVRTGLIEEHLVPAPSTTFVRLGELLQGATLWSAIGQTLQGWLIGLAITVAIAVPVGILLGTFSLLHRTVNGVIEFIRPIPPVALIPVAVLLWGSSGNVVIALVVAGSLWPLMIQVIYGVRDIDPVSKDMAKVFGMKQGKQLLNIVLPGSLPMTMTGLRLAATIGLVIAISTEFIVGVPGLGAEVMLAYQANNLPSTYALVIVTGVLGIVANFAFRALESRMMRWHPSVREGMSS